MLSKGSCIMIAMIEDDITQNSVEENPIPAQNTGSNNKGKVVGIIIAIVILLALIIFSLVSLFRADLETTSKVRDIFIIIMALESLLLGVALIILIIQIAVLINVLKNEIKPILDTTNETVNHLRGTTAFLSNNLVEPVIKMNEYSAGLKLFVDLIKPAGKSRKTKV